MNIWNQIPFLRFLLPFLAGVLTAIYSELLFVELNYILPVLFVVIAGFILFKKLNVAYSYSWAFGTLVGCTLFLSGFHLTVLNTGKFKQDHFSRFIKENAICYVKINEPLTEKERSFKASVTILGIKNNKEWIGTSGKVMCYFQKDSTAQNLRYGDCLLIRSKFNEVKSPHNPGEFDYKQFLSYHNIYHQAYVPATQWASLGTNAGNRIQAISYRLRDYLLDIYRKNDITGDELAVGSALVLGYDDQIDPELMSAYAGSGALHVLSVSGLHVGIIYFIFNFLFTFLEKFKNGRVIKMVLLLFILWFYAALTGLSPSVLRSATMFSFIVIAQTWRYSTNIFNTLAVSCFALLLYDPFLIMQVGFQLSFLAVLGILLIQPWLYEKWQPGNWLMNQIWLITSVSIAAQVATFPLGLLYFHQFPNYFLFSNLIVIPVSTLILGAGILLFAFGNIPVIGPLFAKGFSYLVLALNESVKFVDRTPGALMEGISINIVETFLIYILITLTILWLYRRQVKFLMATMSAAIVLLTVQILEVHAVQNQRSFIVYDVPKLSAMEIVQGTRTVFIADSALINNSNKMLFHIQHNWWERNITHQQLFSIKSNFHLLNGSACIRNNYILFGNKRIVRIGSAPYQQIHFTKKLPADILVLSKNSKLKITDLDHMFVFKKIIIDSSVPAWKKEKWRKECEYLKIDCYSVIDSGAYVEEMPI